MARNGKSLVDRLFCEDAAEGARWGLLALMTGRWRARSAQAAAFPARTLAALRGGLADLGALDPGRRPGSRVHRQALRAVAYLHIAVAGVGLVPAEGRGFESRWSD